MTTNLLRSNTSSTDLRAANWNTIQTASQNDHGIVNIDDDTVASIMRLIDGVVLTNGETVHAYISDNDNDDGGTFVPGFSPAMLPVMVQDQVRDRLATGDNGLLAVALFNEIIRLGCNVALQGSEEGIFSAGDGAYISVG